MVEEGEEESDEDDDDAVTPLDPSRSPRSRSPLGPGRALTIEDADDDGEEGKLADDGGGNEPRGKGHNGNYHFNDKRGKGGAGGRTTKKKKGGGRKTKGQQQSKYGMGRRGLDAKSTVAGLNAAPMAVLNTPMARALATAAAPPGTVSLRTKRAVTLLDSAAERNPRATILRGKVEAGDGAFPKRSSTCNWKGRTNPKSKEGKLMKLQADQAKHGMEEVFKAKVAITYKDLVKPVRIQDVSAIMEDLGRAAPERIVERATAGVPVQDEESLSEVEVVSLIWAVETTRRREVLSLSRLHSKELMAMGDSEEFVRIVGDQTGWFGRQLLMPDNDYVQAFDIVIMFLLIFVFVTLPLCLAFERTNKALRTVNLICDGIFFMDIMKNFNTGYVNEQKVIIVQRDRVVNNYLRTWFLIDLLSCFPITEIVEVAGSKGNQMFNGKKVLKMLRLVRMTKLIKLLRASQLVNKVRHQWVVTMEYYHIHVSDSVLKLVRLFIMMLTLAHWGSCILFLLLRTYKYPKQSWAVLWNLVEHTTGDEVVSVGHAYSWGVYKSLLLVVGQAFQEFPAAQICVTTRGWCLIESWMTLVGTFAGTFFNAAVVSTITAIIVNSNVSTQEFDEQLLRTNEYMRALHLPTELRDRIRDYYFHRWSEGKIFDESLILERLNPELCTEILFYKIRELIPKVPLLRTAGKRFPEILATAMDPQVFIEGDAVFIEGEHGQMMYFIDKGLAEILVSAVGNEVVRLIADGCFFGEAACILKCRRTATIRCKQIMSVYGVHRDTIEPCLTDYPDVGEYLVRLAKTRVERLQQLQVNARLTEGETLLDAEDEEDMRTPLFQSATKSWNSTIKYNANQAGGRGGIKIRQSIWAKKKNQIIAARDGDDGDAADPAPPFTDDRDTAQKQKLHRVRNVTVLQVPKT
ncbi:voltage-gated potassium channel [Aureococcus anophagefferens]|nr:voltage-gated potassium channel [Aureococcus anophagefferens]